MRNDSHARCARYLHVRKERENQNQNQSNGVLHTLTLLHDKAFFAFPEKCQEVFLSILVPSPNHILLNECQIKGEMKTGMSNLAGSAAWLLRCSRPSATRVRRNTIATDVWSSTNRFFALPVITPCLGSQFVNLFNKSGIQVNTLEPEP